MPGYLINCSCFLQDSFVSMKWYAQKSKSLDIMTLLCVIVTLFNGISGHMVEVLNDIAHIVILWMDYLILRLTPKFVFILK